MINKKFVYKVWNGASVNMVGEWNVNTAGITTFWVAHIGSVNCIRFLSAYAFVTGGSDNKLYVWEISSQSKTATFYGHTDDVNCCDKLPNGNVVSGGSDKALYIWNSTNGVTVSSMPSAHSMKILCVKV